MRSGKVYYKDLLAGTIIETNDGEYVFQYDEQYVNDHPQDFITFTMPVTKAHYTNKSILSFFAGLISKKRLLTTECPGIDFLWTD